MQDKELNSSNNSLELVLTPILDSLDVAIADCAELLHCIKEQNYAQSYALIADLLDRVSSLEQAQQPILDELEHSYSEEMLDNLRDVLERIESALHTSEQAKTSNASAPYSDASGLNDPLFLCDVQLQPLVRAAKETFYFWGKIDKSPELRKYYYAHEFAQHRQNPYVASGVPLPFQVTIILVAYNKLSMTKSCVESVLANTDFKQLNAQLILVDHASTDGTLEYFKTIPNAKVIHFKRNMLVTALQMLPQFCRSPYYVHVANDTIVTKDWLDILLTCIKSDPKIAIACPATPNCANLQDTVPTNDCEELIEIAKRRNQSNPRWWNVRAQVHPVIGIFNISILNQIGFWDPAIYTFTRVDCDFSAQARRAGFKQILCCDVYCYHADHGSFSKTHVELDEIGQKLFFRKNGIHPHYLGMQYDTFLLQGLHKYLLLREEQCGCVNCEGTSSKEVNILALNCGVGDSSMQLKTLLKFMGYQARIFHLTDDPLVEVDSKPLVDVFVCVPEEEFLQAIHEQFAGQQFDYVCTDEPQSLEKLSPQFLEAVASRMTDTGVFAFNLKNEFRFNTNEQVAELFATRQPLESWCSVSSKTLNQLVLRLSQMFIPKLITPLEGTLYKKDNLLDLIKQTYGNVKPSDYTPLYIALYTFVCQKRLNK